MKKLIAMVLCFAMVLSMAAVTAAADAEVSVDFEDGKMGFVAVYDGMANSDATALEIAEANGGKALKIVNGSGKIPYVAIDVASLLGEKLADVASVKMTVGLEREGKFYAASGNVMTWEENKLGGNKQAWSVYMEKKNPKEVAYEMTFSADVAPIMVITVESDAGDTKGAPKAAVIIDDIAFLDAEGKVIPANTDASFAAPSGFGGSKDMSNLFYLDETQAVTLDGMSGKSGGAWSQDGVEMTEEFKAALVPGSVIEIEYSSTSGDAWIVMNQAQAGWMRVGSHDDPFGRDYMNMSRNVAQVTFEMIAARCGEDVSTWGPTIQCESSGDWEIYSMKVAPKTGLVMQGSKTVLDDVATTGGAWGQAGFEMSEEFKALMVPGAVIEIKYASESGDMWIVMNQAEAGWMRCGSGDDPINGLCPHNGSIAQVTYEMIAARCGEDVNTWGPTMQFESSGNWEVYSISVSNEALVPVKGAMPIEGAACTGGAWGQTGFEMSDDLKAALVPGAVITIAYESEANDMWIVMNQAQAGWMRCGSGDDPISGLCPHSATIAQVTYEMIAARCGEDVSTWGPTMQFESSGNWEVFSATIGMAANAPAEETAEETEAEAEAVVETVEETEAETEAAVETVEETEAETEAAETVAEAVEETVAEAA